MSYSSPSCFRIQPSWRCTSSGSTGEEANSKVLIVRKLFEKRHKCSTSTDEIPAADMELPPILLPDSPSQASSRKIDHHHHHPNISPDLQATPSTEHLRWILKSACVEAALQFHQAQEKKEKSYDTPQAIEPRDCSSEGEEESPLSNRGSSIVITSFRDILKKRRSEEEATNRGLRQITISSLQVFGRAKSTRNSSDLANGATTIFPLQALLADLDTMTNKRAVRAVTQQSRGWSEDQALHFLFTQAREQLQSLGMFGFGRNKLKAATPSKARDL